MKSKAVAAIPSTLEMFTIFHHHFIKRCGKGMQSSKTTGFILMVVLES